MLFVCKFVCLVLCCCFVFVLFCFVFVFVVFLCCWLGWGFLGGFFGGCWGGGGMSVFHKNNFDDPHV